MQVVSALCLLAQLVLTNVCCQNQEAQVPLQYGSDTEEGDEPSVKEEWKPWTCDEDLPASRCNGQERKRCLVDCKCCYCNGLHERRGHWQLDGICNTCYNGGTYRNPECQCQDENYGDCCYYVCPMPEYCVSQTCTTASNSLCKKCEDNGGNEVSQAYYLDDGHCIPKCNWLGHWCYPGTCDEDENNVSSTCECSEGFEIYNPDKETSKCKLVQKPDILGCRSAAESEHGDIATTVYSNNRTDCTSTIDAHVNFIPAKLSFDYQFVMQISPPDETHAYVESFSIGVVDLWVNIRKYDKEGLMDNIDTISLPNMEANCTHEDISREEPLTVQASCRYSEEYSFDPVLHGGEKYCLEFVAVASGYLNIKDMTDGTIKRYDEYGDTTANTEKCFITDLTPPNHCSNLDPPCSNEVIQFGPRIRRDRQFTVNIEGWFDPSPDSVFPEPSGMKGYILEVKNVQWSGDILKPSFDAIDSFTIDGVNGSIQIEIEDRTQPSMFALYLEALDSTQADSNYLFARRFVLIDNSSQVALNKDYPIIPILANNATSFLWQNTLSFIKLDWKNHFFNTFHKPINHLLPIELDTKIAGVFDQETGELPVSGTPNKDGIINFFYAYQRTRPFVNDTEEWKEVPDPLEERLTISDLKIQDGDTVEINIKALDIMNNSKTDNITLYIDSTAPQIDIQGLTKDGQSYIYAHNSTNLAEMNMSFLAYDVHSGLYQVKWTLGTSLGLSDIGNGALAVKKLTGNCLIFVPTNSKAQQTNENSKRETCMDALHCHCPSIGPCQLYSYTVPLQGIVANGTHEGDHHRDYYFSFEITNEARLVTKETFSVLIDVTPPETGYIYDGPQGSADRDFQSSPLMNSHWLGFIDHESGISKYTYAIGTKCFSRDELMRLEPNTTGLLTSGETSDTFVSYLVERPAKYFTSVIAYNGAMDPSEAVCSSGLVYDRTPPEIQNITVFPATFVNSIVCTANESNYFLYADGTIQELENVTKCEEICLKEFIANHQLFPEKKTFVGNSSIPLPIDAATSQKLCTLFPVYTNDTPLFLPSTEIGLHWNFIEKESQILDTFVGLTESKSNLYNPNLQSFQSTNNATHFQCSHCGLGHADIFSIVLMTRNKAGLDHTVTIGPTIVDLTPPVQNGMLNVSQTEEKIFLSWDFDAFMDSEDESFIYKYQWALGTKDNQAEVSFWKDIIFPWTIFSQEEREMLFISYPVADLLHHDQGKLKAYVFSLKAFNRAGHHILVSSEEFKVQVPNIPKTGLLYHVDNTNFTEVYYQESLDYICAKWIGFGMQENISLGVGSEPNNDDVIKFVSVKNQGTFCFKNITFDSMFKYYLVISTDNGLSIAETSKGIFLGSSGDIYHSSSVNNGFDCSYAESVNIASNMSLTAANPVTIPFDIPLSSWMKKTLIVTVNDAQSKRGQVNAFINEREIELVFQKENLGDVQLYYSFMALETNNTLMLNSENPNQIVITTIDVHNCIQGPTSQEYATQLQANWNFNKDVQQAISHFEVAFYLAQNNSNETPLTSYQAVGKETQFMYKTSVFTQNIYVTKVKPCFVTQCLPPVHSAGTIIVSEPPIYGKIAAEVTHSDHVLSSYNYVLEGEWDVFLELTASGYFPIHLYDWAISLDEDGTNLITEWERVLANQSMTSIQVTKQMSLHIHRDKAMFFAIRFQLQTGKTSTVTSRLSIKNEIPSKMPQVLDIHTDLDLAPWMDMLHSANLGPYAESLYAEEVDFTSNVHQISGVVVGTVCESYSWSLQKDEPMGCLQSPGKANCVAEKLSNDNTVDWNRMEFMHATHYFICVQPNDDKCSSFRTCSNGFVVDTKSPVAGHVTLGLIPERDIQMETSLTKITWNGFYDLEEEMDIPFANGIQRYEVRLGSSPGQMDIHALVEAGQSSGVILSDLNMSSGLLYFATVTAYDHAGNSVRTTSTGLMVDNTPPSAGIVSFIVYSKDQLVVSYSGFDDYESGIISTSVAIGSDPRSIDILLFQEVDDNPVVLSSNLPFHDGHHYYAHIRVEDGAGLWTTAVSPELLIDFSPPLTGHINLGLTGKDVGWYTRNNRNISFHWEGFSDPHSGIAFYKVAIGTGTEEFCDILPWLNVGQQNEFHVEIHLPVGKEHFISVEACNGALLCSTLKSPVVIVDISPPLMGHVIVGNSEQHMHWHSSREFISAKWFGILDPESDIHHYEWCIGTKIGICDILPYHNIHKEHSFIKTNLNLPLSVKMFVNVMATNHVGLSSLSSSKSFQIDHTPPTVLTRPNIMSNPHAKTNVHFDRSFLTLQWKFEDSDSPLYQHSISITSHHDGVVPLSDLIVGDVSKATITLPMDKRLRDGTIYTVKVTACNAARLCTFSSSADFVVDSSPPTRGAFIDPMHWHKTSGITILSLKWDNFTDPHSGIHRYIVSISSAYNGHDLSNGVVLVPHKNNERIQGVDIEILQNLEPNSLLFVNIIAENNAGLFSDVYKKTMTMFSSDKEQSKSGILEVIKHSSDIHYCTLDCTCAPLDQVCIPETAQANCKQLNQSDFLHIYDGVKPNVRTITPSSMCLQGYWTYDESADPTRFTWSVSQQDHDAGYGIFDPLKEKVWFDVELYTSSAYCMPQNKTLVHGQTYIYHVRMWYDYSVYSHVMSQGVLVDITPPIIRLGKHILQMDSSFQTVLHFTTDLSGVFSKWDDVFEDKESGIMFYMVAIGTSPGGSEILAPTNVGLNTTFAFTEKILSPGEHYYTTIYAYNYLSMVSHLTSRGVLVDTEAPMAGTVYTNVDYQNKHFHSSMFRGSWNGFFDKHSFIKEYYYQIDRCSGNATETGYINNGINSMIEINALDIPIGVEKCLFVYAKDAAGHSSEIIVSEPFVIDETTPIALTCRNYKKTLDHILACNCSGIIPGHHTEKCICSNPEDIPIRHSSLYKIKIIVESVLTVKAQLEIGNDVSEVHFSRTGYKSYAYERPFFSYVDKKVHPVIHFLKSSESKTPFIFKLTLSKCPSFEEETGSFTSALTIVQSGISRLHISYTIADHESFIAKMQLRLGTTETGSQWLPLTDVSSMVSTDLDLDLRHNISAYSTLVVHNRAGLWSHFNGQPIIIDLTPPAIAGINVVIESDETGVTLHAYWNVTDKESKVTDCEWQAGLFEGGSNIVLPAESETLVSSVAYNQSLNHGDYVHVTVTCHNEVGLFAVSHSQPKPVILDRPDGQHGYVNFHLQPQTHYKPSGKEQASSDTIKFSYHNFANTEMDFVGHYEAQLEHDPWTSIDKLDTIVLTSVNPQDEYKYNLRAINTVGMCSNTITDILSINSRKPSLTGGEIGVNLDGNELILNWDGVFAWDGNSLQFEIFAGTKEGMADILKAHVTKTTSVQVTSPVLKPGSECSVVIHAVTPAGIYSTKRQLTKL